MDRFLESRPLWHSGCSWKDEGVTARGRDQPRQSKRQVPLVLSERFAYNCV